MKLFRITISLLLILSLIFSPVACSTTQEKLNQTQTQSSKVTDLGDPEYRIDDDDVKLVIWAVYYAPIWVPIVAVWLLYEGAKKVLKSNDETTPTKEEPIDAFASGL